MLQRVWRTGPETELVLCPSNTFSCNEMPVVRIHVHISVSEDVNRNSLHPLLEPVSGRHGSGHHGRHGSTHS